MNDRQKEEIITKCLNGACKEIKPPKELLEKILIAAAKKPAVPPRKEKIQFILNWKFFSVAGIAVIVLAAVFSFSSGFGFFHQSAELADQNINNNQPLTSDDIDGAANAILASADDEDSALQSDVDNESSPNDDGGAIKNLIQNYAQDQF
jgi:hypothetical protein